MGCGAADDVVKALEAVGSSANGRLLAFDEALVPDS
jgi:hypothetical protein